MCNQFPPRVPHKLQPPCHCMPEARPRMAVRVAPVPAHPSCCYKAPPYIGALPCPLEKDLGMGRRHASARQLAVRTPLRCHPAGSASLSALPPAPGRLAGAAPLRLPGGPLLGSALLRHRQAARLGLARGHSGSLGCTRPPRVPAVAPPAAAAAASAIAGARVWRARRRVPAHLAAAALGPQALPRGGGRGSRRAGARRPHAAAPRPWQGFRGLQLMAQSQ